jgi:DNA replication protein DnaC
MPANDGNVMSQWPAIEELALTRSRGLPVHELLRNSTAKSYDAERDILTLAVRVQTLDKNLAESLRTCVAKACYQVLGHQPSLEFRTDSAPGKSEKGGSGKVSVEVAAEPASLSSTSGTQDFLTQQKIPAGLDFGHFVVGPSNQLAAAAAQAVAENPGKAYNPLFIHGGVGLGKTHLLNAIARKLLPRMPKIRMISCEEFVNRFVGALKSGGVEAFRRPGGQGTDAGRVLPHVQPSLSAGQADRADQRQPAPRHPQPRRPADQPLPLGPRGQGRAALHRNPHGDRAQEGRNARD